MKCLRGISWLHRGALAKDVPVQGIKSPGADGVALVCVWPPSLRDVQPISGAYSSVPGILLKLEIFCWCFIGKLHFLRFQRAPGLFAGSCNDQWGWWQRAGISWCSPTARRGEELGAELLALLDLSVTTTSRPERFIGYDCQILHRCQINFDILYS